MWSLACTKNEDCDQSKHERMIIIGPGVIKAVNVNWYRLRGIFFSQFFFSLLYCLFINSKREKMLAQETTEDLTLERFVVQGSKMGVTKVL